MTSAVVTLAMIAIGGSALALADPPVAPEAQSTAAQSTDAQDTAGQSSPAHAAAAVTAAAPAAKPAPSTSATTTPNERMAEQQLRLEGYRLTMVRGQEKYCRREAPLGTRLESVMHCVTLAEAEAMAHEGKETTERIQRNTSGCLSPAAGGCGK